MERGQLRVYLGAAPGVGKTVAMLDEGQRRLARGTDVVVAFVEDHGRAHTRGRIDGLEVIPRRAVEYRGAQFMEMDLDAVLARRPEVALVDELAHTNVTGSKHAKRWEDVQDLLDAGIDVITTVNIQHLESLNDVVGSITGTKQRETLPDDVVRKAEQIELVDMAPEALRRRLAHGNVYAAEKIDAALSNYFRVGNLTALRELALLWVADRVDEGLVRYRESHGIESSWPTRERVVVALTGGPEGDALIRRGARIAGRTAGRELIAVHVARSDGLSGADPEALGRQRTLVTSLGGSFHSVAGDDVAESLLAFARGVNATQLVVGISRRSRWQQLLGQGVGNAVVQGSGEIDVHMVTHEAAGGGHRRKGRRALSQRRTVAGWLLALLGTLALAGLLKLVDEKLSLTSDLLLFLTWSVFVALVGGLWPALASAILGSLLANWLFTPPFGTFTIAEPENALALLIFVVVAAAVASVVDLAAQRTKEAAEAQAESVVLSSLAGSVIAGDDTVDALLEQLRETFSLSSVSLIAVGDRGQDWQVLAHAGEVEPQSRDDVSEWVAVNGELQLGLTGPDRDARDQRILRAYGARVGVLLERQRIALLEAEADRLSEGNAVRTALLAALSHDLRTPLAGIKAAVSSLRQDDVEWSQADEAALLQTVEESADRLDALLTNLLHVSRLQAGVMPMSRSQVAVEDLVSRSLGGLTVDDVADVIHLAIPADLPLVDTDAGLAERVLANLLENALRHGATSRIDVTAGLVGDRVEVRVVDRGPGVPDSMKQRIFAPFQRLGDAPDGSGIGLGLAVARGLAEALDGTLSAEDTPGGGLTMVLALPVVTP